jgi:hypothetical protein
MIEKVAMVVACLHKEEKGPGIYSRHQPGLDRPLVLEHDAAAVITLTGRVDGSINPCLLS